MEMKGSGGGGGGGHDHGHDDLGKHGYQALLAAVQSPHGVATHGLINPMPSSYAHLQTTHHRHGHAPPMHHCQPGCYQAAGAASNNIAHQFPRGFADWRSMYSSSPFASLAQATSCYNSFHQNFAPCSATWTNMLKNPCCNYATHAEGDPLCHHNNHDKESAFVSSLRVVPSVLSGSPFPAMSPSPNDCSCVHFFEGSASAKKSENSEDCSRIATSSELETKNSDELDVHQAPEHPSLKHGHESWAGKFDCREYYIILRKELTNSDVGNIGRIVLPKKDAEANLPPLFERDGMILEMDDLVLPVTWKFKYRFWPNNKSRMYILETTGEFVKTHGLQTGDILMIYKSSASGKFIVRGTKNIQQTASLHVLECNCKKEGIKNEDCGFTMNLQSKRT